MTRLALLRRIVAVKLDGPQQGGYTYRSPPKEKQPAQRYWPLTLLKKRSA
jgi:hypothetical protein